MNTNLGKGRKKEEHMEEEEKKAIADALKRYCELDTMAMVIIMEAWKDMVK
jgi:hypothetical protein